MFILLFHCYSSGLYELCINSRLRVLLLSMVPAETVMARCEPNTNPLPHSLTTPRLRREVNERAAKLNDLCGAAPFFPSSCSSSFFLLLFSKRAN